MNQLVIDSEEEEEEDEWSASPASPCLQLPRRCDVTRRLSQRRDVTAPFLCFHVGDLKVEDSNYDVACLYWLQWPTWDFKVDFKVDIAVGLQLFTSTSIVYFQAKWPASWLQSCCELQSWLGSRLGSWYELQSWLRSLLINLIWLFWSQMTSKSTSKLLWTSKLTW